MRTWRTMKTRSILLIGYGSIGKRHARNLIEMGLTPFILTKHPDDLNATFLNDVSELGGRNIEYCIICSPTSEHLDSLKKCLSLKHGPKKILIEKPLEATYAKGIQVKKISEKFDVEIFVAYNLRFLEVFKTIRGFLEKNKGIRIVEIVAGQDLKEWRSARDYTRSYSAHREQGGGVDLDLSHEIDYVLWLFGDKIIDKMMYRKKISDLEIDSPDIFKLFLRYERFVVDVTLDYIRKPKTRYIRIICENGENLYYDFTTNRIDIRTRETTFADSIGQSYKRMLMSFLADETNKRKLCTIEEGLKVLKILEV